MTLVKRSAWPWPAFALALLWCFFACSPAGADELSEILETLKTGSNKVDNALNSLSDRLETLEETSQTLATELGQSKRQLSDLKATFDDIKKEAEVYKVVALVSIGLGAAGILFAVLQH